MGARARTSRARARTSSACARTSRAHARLRARQVFAHVLSFAVASVRALIIDVDIFGLLPATPAAFVCTLRTAAVVVTK